MQSCLKNAFGYLFGIKLATDEDDDHDDDDGDDNDNDEKSSWYFKFLSFAIRKMVAKYSIFLIFTHERWRQNIWEILHLESPAIVDIAMIS